MLIESRKTEIETVIDGYEPTGPVTFAEADAPASEFLENAGKRSARRELFAGNDAHHFIRTLATDRGREAIETMLADLAAAEHRGDEHIARKPRRHPLLPDDGIGQHQKIVVAQVEASELGLLLHHAPEFEFISEERSEPRLRQKEPERPAGFCVRPCARGERAPDLPAIRHLPSASAKNQCKGKG